MINLALYGSTPVRSEPYVQNTIGMTYCWGVLGKSSTGGHCQNSMGGPLAREFETSFSKKHGKRFGVSTNSGTSALHVCYQALGLSAGDEVILPANAYVSALSAALQLNAIPRLCDVGYDNNMNVAHLRALIGPRTRMVVPVHLYGYPADMPAIMRVAREHELVVVEDCGQGHGASMNARRDGILWGLRSIQFLYMQACHNGRGGDGSHRRKRYCATTA